MNKVILVILDGFGEAPAGPGNAITLAATPNLQMLRKEYPFGIVQSNGEAVGLVAGSMGGSEVGHFTMGSGRITPQFLLAINRDIKSGELFKNAALKGAFDYAKANQKPLHLMGMISDKGVHSHIDHLLALLEWAKKDGIKEVYVHCIGDGRDVEERSIKRYLKQVQDKIDELGVGKIATIIGRYFSMDRDKNWDRTQIAYKLITQGAGEKFADPMAAIDHFYAADAKLTDYYMPAICIDPKGVIKEGDAVIFFNYRTDRTRQLTSAFTDPNFAGFKGLIGKVNFVCMGPYSDFAPVAYNMPVVKNNLAHWLGDHGIKQLHVAETEKYAHVTFFFNSQIEQPAPGEDRIMINSPKVPSYAEKPEMSANEVTDTVLKALIAGDHEVIIVNFANCDLVGHSGNLKATIKAVETVDHCLGQIYEKAMEKDYTFMLTGDHGNADDMLYPDGSQKPAHSMNPVILLVADPQKMIKKVKDGGLSDIAPTLLKIVGLPKPDEMTGESLI